MKNKKGILFITGGLLLVASALTLTGYNLWDESRAGKEVESLAKQLRAEAEITVSFEDTGVQSNDKNLHESDNHIEGNGSPDIPAYVLNPDMEMPVETIDDRDYIGILEVPSLNLVLPIISDWSYPALKTAPCRYEGSVYQDSMILAGHNYKSHFGPLGNLKGGEQVIFTDVEGNVFYYEVVLKEVLTSTSIEEMKEDEWDLTLFTCTLGGQNRITIRCKKV